MLGLFFYKSPVLSYSEVRTYDCFIFIVGGVESKIKNKNYKALYFKRCSFI